MVFNVPLSANKLLVLIMCQKVTGFAPSIAMLSAYGYIMMLSYFLSLRNDSYSITFILIFPDGPSEVFAR